MKSILEELYNGEIIPYEIAVPKDPEYKKMFGELSNKLDVLKTKISDENFKEVESLLDLQSDAHSFENLKNFNYGFKLGGLIIMEMLLGKGDLVRNKK